MLKKGKTGLRRKEMGKCLRRKELGKEILKGGKRKPKTERDGLKGKGMLKRVRGA